MPRILLRWIQLLRGSGNDRPTHVLFRVAIVAGAIATISAILRVQLAIRSSGFRGAHPHDCFEESVQQEESNSLRVFKESFWTVEGVNIDFVDVETGRSLETEAPSPLVYGFDSPCDDRTTVAQLIAQRCALLRSDSVRVVIRDGDDHVSFGGKTIGEIRRSFAS